MKFQAEPPVLGSHQTQKAQHVVAAVIVNAGKEVLLSLRPAHVHQGGLWEFPGGKVEPGEDIRQALDRELKEELDIAPISARPMIRIRHDYPDKSVLLDVWYVDRFTGMPQGREGQELNWVAPGQLIHRKFPAANIPIVNAARLPPLYLITPEPGTDIAGFFITLERALKAGVQLMQLRANTCTKSRYQALAQQAGELCRRYGAALLLNSPPDLIDTTGAGGVHLNSARLMAINSRPVAKDKWFAASCHNRQELEKAKSLGADFIVVSPVLPTSSHPEARVLDWEGLNELCEHATMPVYALGGMTPQHISKAWRHGAQGIAAISAIWRSSTMERDIHACLNHNYDNSG